MTYSPARPKGQAVTSADRFVSITRSDGGRPTSTVTFSDPATVVGLADGFNSLASTVTRGMSCPPSAVSYTVRFGPSPAAPANFVARGVDCGAWSVTTPGTGAGELQDSTALDNLMSALAGPVGGP